MTRRFRTAEQRARGRIVATIATCIILGFHLVPGLDLSERASGQCQYSTVVIEGPPCPFGGLAVLRGRGLNNHGHVVGHWDHCSDAGTEAFFWSPETGRVTLPQPDTVFRAIANDINDHGLIVGNHEFFSNTGLGRRGFVYDPKTGEYTYLEPLHDDATGFVSDAIAINNDGIVAGRRSIGKSSTPYNAVIWDTNTGEVTDLGVMNGPNSQAEDLNDATNAVGWMGSSPFTSGMPTGFIVLPTQELIVLTSGEYVFSACRDTNTDGHVVGSIWLVPKLAGSRAMLWMDHEILLIEPPEGYIASGSGNINSLGQVLVTNSAGTPSLLTTIWQHGEMVPLNSLIAPGGVGIQTPNAINDVGQILVRHNTPKAVLLTPVDQPFADLDANCRTDIHDLVMLLNWWGECPPVKPGGVDFCTADLNDDGIVNVFDLLILLGNWD